MGCASFGGLVLDLLENLAEVPRMFKSTAKSSSVHPTATAAGQALGAALTVGARAAAVARGAPTIALKAAAREGAVGGVRGGRGGVRGPAAVREGRRRLRLLRPRPARRRRR